MRRIVRLMFVIVLAASRVHAADKGYPQAIPSGVQVSDDLRRHMEVMLQRSTTFREQCLRLEAPGMRVVVQRDVELLDRPYRARTTIARTVGGVLVATVSISAYGDPTEWLAHEFEHLIEQLDGVRVRQLAAGRDRGVWATNGGMFETSRAIRVGRLVKDEMREHGRTVARAAAQPSVELGMQD